MKIETVPIASIRKNGSNPRNIKDSSFKKLVASVKSFPEMLLLRPVVVDADGVILGGNMRYEACIAAGMTEVPILRAADLTEEQRREFVIKDNVSGGDWDWDVLANEWDADLLQEWGLDLPLGFGRETTAGLTDEDSVPEVPADPVTRMGDLWLLGRHRLLCGDSTSIAAVERLMGGQHWNVCVFDPPYEVETLYSDAMPTPAAGQKLIVMWDFKRFAVAPKCALDAGWLPCYELVWDCVQSWYTPNRPLQRHKSIGVFGDDPTFNTDEGIIRDGKDRGERRTVKNTRGKSDYQPMDGAKHLATVESFPNTCQNDSHAHGKPVQWIEAVFNGLGGELFLDLFGGSGTSIIACEKTGRACCTMELDQKYCDVIVKRWQDFTGQQATLEADGRAFEEVSNAR